MLDFLANVVATTLEGVCLFTLTLNLFRFRARDYVVGITIANIIVSVSNYLMQKYDYFYDYTMLLNFTVFVLILIFVFRVALFESMVMSVCGFLAALVIQAILFGLFTLFVKTTLHDVRVDDYKYLLQLVSALSYLVVTKIINKQHWWFTFVPFKWRFNIKLTRLNVAIILAVVATILFLGLFIKYYNFVIITACVVILFAVTLFLTIKKEKKSDRHHLSENC